MSEPAYTPGLIPRPARRDLKPANVAREGPPLSVLAALGIVFLAGCMVGFFGGIAGLSMLQHEGAPRERDSR